jgi:hypothetical protein
MSTSNSDIKPVELITAPKPGDRPYVEALAAINATDNEKAAFEKGMYYVNKVLESDCFGDGILTANLTETNGLSNANHSFFSISKSQFFSKSSNCWAV